MAEPYPGQGRAMDAIGDALAGGRNVLFEGACGTGKTLAALAPALSHARATDRTVVITTNVNQQARQFVREATALRTAADPPIRTAVFRGKAAMCHLDVGYEECRVLRETTEEEFEGELEDPAAAETCEYYYGTLSADDAAFAEWLHDDVRTPEDVYAYADRRGECGYELLKAAMADVDLVICNYNHLLDPTIRPAFFRWLDRSPEEVVAVFDEAHNVAPSAREHGTRTLTDATIDAALEELAAGGDDAVDAELDEGRADRARAVLGPFREALVAVCEDAIDAGSGTAGLSALGTDVEEDWRDVTVLEDGRDRLRTAFLRAYGGDGLDGDLDAAAAAGETLDQAYERAYRSGETDVRHESATRTAASFLEAYLAADEGSLRHPVAGVRRVGDGLRRRAELYTTLPHPVTGPLFEELSASVLLSATLRPFDVLADSLGLPDPVTVTEELSFPPSNRRTFAVGTPPLFASQREDPDVQGAVADALADAVGFAAGNVLCFFPSYGEAERYHGLVADRLADAGRRGETFLDGPGTDGAELRETFVERESAALFTSVWGTLTEGVSFDGDDASTAVVVGVPYPRLDDRTDAVQAAYADAFGDESDHPDPGWLYAVEAPTVRKTRQALGRVLRGPEEVGARILLDRRYCRAARRDLGRYSVYDTFPAALREELVDVDPGRLRYALSNFYREHEAYPGVPPEP